MTNNVTVVDERFEAGRGAVRSYVIGFILAILLTLIPYFMVVNHVVSNTILANAIILFAILQLFAQVIFFLHLSRRSKPYWNFIVFAYTGLLVTILVIGTMWIMNNLNYNMMEATPFHSNEGYIPNARLE